MTTTLDRPPLPMGTVVIPWGRIEAVGIVNGERYYWFVDGEGTVSMQPATEVEGRRWI